MSYKEYYPGADTSLRPDGYKPLGVLADGGFDSVPMNSALKLSTSEDGKKFFSTARDFQSREDSVRIAAPAKTPVSVTVREIKQVADSNGQEVVPVMSGDYQWVRSAYAL